MDIKKNVGIRINSALVRCNMLQKDLAKVLGVTDNTISYYCKGARGPQLEQLPKIAEALNTTTDYLLGLTNDPYPKRTAIDDLGITPAVAEKFMLRKKLNCTDSDLTGKYNRVLENDDVWILLALIHGYMTAVKADSIYWELESKYDGGPIDNEELCKMLLEKAEEYRAIDIDLCDFLEAKANIINWDTKDSMLSLGMDEFDLSEIWSLRITRQLEETLYGIRRGNEQGID